MAQALFEHGAGRLAEIVRPGVLCAFDFDGTLSAIVDQPDQASLAPEVVRRLAELSTLAPVAIVTGRSLADIRPRLRFAPHFLVGNHGMEGLAGDEGRVERYRAQSRGWKDALAQALRDPGIDRSVWIEDKSVSLSVHFRLAQDPARTALQLARLFAALAPAPRVVAGKFVFNLVAPGAADKGAALERLMQASGAPSAIYVGDDVTDEDVFQLRRADLLSVRIEPDPASAATYYLHQQGDIVRLLDDLIARLRPPPGLGAPLPSPKGTS